MFKRLNIKLKRKIRKWLGLDDIFMGIDIGCNNETKIIIVSKLHGGHIKIIDIYPENFKHLRLLIDELQIKYGIHKSNVIYDKPVGMLKDW